MLLSSSSQATAAPYSASRSAKISSHPGVAEIIEVGEVNGWQIRRCDAMCLLLLEPEGESDSQRHSHAIMCTPREYRMLVSLLEQFGRPVAFAALLHGPFDFSRDRPLFRPHIARVRKKIAHLGIIIRPVKGYGYIAQVNT